jgi:hypothetical protein
MEQSLFVTAAISSPNALAAAAVAAALSVAVSDDPSPETRAP